MNPSQTQVTPVKEKISSSNETSAVLKSSERKYAALYTYSIILQVIGWFFIVVGSFTTVYGVIQFSGDNYYSASAGSTILMGGIGMALAGLFAVATGQVMCVWRDTEENTRRIANLLESKKER